MQWKEQLNIGIQEQKVRNDMADIEFVVRLDQETLQDLYDSRYVSPHIKEVFRSATPLPKGHGRIVDIGPYEGKVIASRKYCGVNKLVEVAELDTIIEADKAESVRIRNDY